MKQILQSLKTGATEVAQVPVPRVSRGSLLIQTSQTLVSAGSERMLVEFGKAGWIEKARQQPDKVRMVLDKIKTDGLQLTIDTVFNRLEQPLPMGYCNAGRVVAVGSGVKGFEVGDRVISNGKHAEIVSVPVNLCAKVPDIVSDEEAAFTVLSSIALQGIRLAQPSLGETLVVTGLGLVGLLTVQLLRAHGCRVLGLDFDKEKLNFAQKFGAEVVDLASGQDPLKVADLFSRGRGVDAVIIAAATKSSEPIHQAAQMCRKRGRIILIGDTGLELSRDDFYKKELTFQVSASYGPGRYDTNYEEKGQDYPVGFVRWTEQRNFEAVLDMMADGNLNVKPLISHRFFIDDAEKVYDLLGGDSKSLGILLTYPGIEATSEEQTVLLEPKADLQQNNSQSRASATSVSFIGAGNYATSILIPAFKDAGASLWCVSSSTGVSGLQAGNKFGFHETTTDSDRIFLNEKTDAVVITTRHDSHSRFVLQALNNGKHVFVEKPLCLTLSELNDIQSAYRKVRADTDSPPLLMVGFNRRFAPQIQRMKDLLKELREPKTFIMTVNAGSISADHWTQDSEVGGGRVIGEACHFIDLLRFMAGCPIQSCTKATMDASTDDTTTISLKFIDGSVGTIHYFANGSKSFPKERLEVFSGGRILQLDNYRKLTGYGWPGFSKMNLWRQNKGQIACARAFVDAISAGDKAPIPIDELFEVSRFVIEIANS